MDFISGLSTGVAIALIVFILSRGTMSNQARYHYFVSFYIISQDNATGFGSVNIIRQSPIDSLAEVQALGETLRREQNAKGVTVLNIQEMDG